MSIGKKSPLSSSFMIMFLLIVGCLLLGVEWFIGKQSFFLGFYGLFGFLAYIFVITCAYALRFLVSTKKDPETLKKSNHAKKTSS